MRTPRLALASVAAGGALVMGTVLALPAAADPNLPCQEHPGYTCTAHNEAAVGLHVGVAVNDLAALRARVNLNTPCADVAGLLVQAQLGVRTSHKAVVSDQQAVNKARQDVHEAQKADDAAAAKLAAAQSTYDAAVANLAVVKANPASTPAQIAVAQQKVTDALTALNAAKTAKANADTALANAKTAERAAEAQYNADRSAETVAAGLVVTLRTNLINCRIPVPTPAPTTEPAPETTVVVTPPATQPSDVFITPAQPPVIVNNPQVGVVPQGPAPTGAVDSADRYLG